MFCYLSTFFWSLNRIWIFYNLWTSSNKNISEAHLRLYLAEFDFRANTRDLNDAERAASLLAGAKGKRLLYRQPDKAAHA